MRGEVERRVLEVRLRERVLYLWQEYRRHSEEYRAALTDLNSQLMPRPDGRFRLAQIGQQEARALQAYSAALRQFKELVVDGKLPDEQDVF